MKRKGIIFKFFTSKLSSIFTPAYQGITQVVDAAATVIAPVTDALTDLPVIGAVIDSTLTTIGQAVANTGDTLHTVVTHVAAGDVGGAVDQLLDDATDLVGGALQDVSGVVADLGQVIDPITGQALSDVSILGDVLSAAGVTIGNASGLVDEVGGYVTGIDPLDTLGQLASDPFATIGGVETSLGF